MWVDRVRGFSCDAVNGLLESNNKIIHTTHRSVKRTRSISTRTWTDEPLPPHASACRKTQMVSDVQAGRNGDGISFVLRPHSDLSAAHHSARCCPSSTHHLNQSSRNKSLLRRRSTRGVDSKNVQGNEEETDCRTARQQRT